MLQPGGRWTNLEVIAEEAVDEGIDDGVRARQPVEDEVGGVVEEAVIA